MITPVRYDDLGRFSHSWLEARYHFSFSTYHNPLRMGFGPLRVVNDDIVKAGGGFDFHPHRDMEIITYVREGAITHTDNLGNSGRTEAGDVQIMSAGTGIVHAEHNHEAVPTRLYQIWIEPSRKGLEPRWETKQFPKTPGESLTLLVSGEHNPQPGTLVMHQRAAIWAGRLKAGSTLRQPVAGRAYVLVSHGRVQLGDTLLEQGDGAQIEQEHELRFHAPDEAEVLLIDMPELRLQ